MRVNEIHRVSWRCPDMGNRQAFFTTWNKAMRFARRNKIADSATLDIVEIPKTRVALCDWLNKHFGTDNG